MATKKIKIVRVSTLIYTPDECDLGNYAEKGAYNIDQIALADLDALENGEYTLEEVVEYDGDLEVDDEYSVSLVDIDNVTGVILAEDQPDAHNEKRDYNYFPETEEETANKTNVCMVPACGCDGRAHP